MVELLIRTLDSLTGGTIYALSLIILLACGMGLPIPEDVVLLTGGYYVTHGKVSLIPFTLLALFGVLVGDAGIYYLGRRYGKTMLQMPGFRHMLTEARIQHVRSSFDKYGNVFIFFARFAAGIRSATFWSCGYFHVPFKKFILLDGIAALVSVPALVYLGALLGHALDTNLPVIKRYEKYIGLAAAAIIITLIIRHRFQRRHAEKAASDAQSPQSQDSSPT